MSPALRKVLRAVAIAALLAVVVTAAASACPLCKEDVAGDGPGVWRGMFWSILLMVSMPFAAAGTVILLILRAKRRQAAAAPAAKAPLSFPESRGAHP